MDGDGHVELEERGLGKVCGRAWWGSCFILAQSPSPRSRYRLSRLKLVACPRPPQSAIDHLRYHCTHHLRIRYHCAVHIHRRVYFSTMYHLVPLSLLAIGCAPSVHLRVFSLPGRLSTTASILIRRPLHTYARVRVGKKASAPSLRSDIHSTHDVEIKPQTSEASRTYRKTLRERSLPCSLRAA